MAESCGKAIQTIDKANIDPWSASPHYDSRKTDIVLVVEDHEFEVHKDVLQKSCDYFRAMFASEMIEMKKNKINIEILKSDSFETILHSFYTGEMILTPQNVFSVTENAQMLQINKELYDQCIKFLLGMIDNDFCFDVMIFCDLYHIQDVYKAARNYCLANFETLRQSSTFQHVSTSVLIGYLSDECLVCDQEIDIVEALQFWLLAHSSEQERAQHFVRSCVPLGNKPEACDIITTAITEPGNKLSVDQKVLDSLGTRQCQQDLWLFWSLHSSTQGEDGLVDIIRVCELTGQGHRVDSMKPILEQPGYDLGSALCVSGRYVYLSGGGPGFGKVNWIRQLWRYDCLGSGDRWLTVGDLIETRRHHAMAVLRGKLYVFGGFGKFRTRNSALHCFDLASKTWSQCENMPVHEIKPACTVYQNNIMYIDHSWQIHCFNVVTGKWTSFTEDSLPASAVTGRGIPTAIYKCPGDAVDNFLLVLKPFQVATVRLDWQDKNYCVIHLTQCNINLEWFDSVVANAQLYIRFNSQGEEGSDNNQESSGYLMTFDPTSHTLSEKVLIKDVEKALNFLAVPKLPALDKI